MVVDQLKLTARRLGLGKFARLYYHRPIGILRQSVAEGGPLQQHKMAIGHAEMKSAAMSMPVLEEPANGPPASVAFLSGANFWHQTLFCYISLQIVCPYKITPIIFDDGQLDLASQEHFQRVVPWARFVKASEIEATLDLVLPQTSFPTLRNHRKTYIHLRKLIDINVCVSGYNLILDSDMLFFRCPDELLRWFDCPFSMYMQDVACAYGYPISFLNKILGSIVPECVNVGLYSLNSSSIHWDLVEYWCRIQLETYGPNYFQEQALTAMLFAGRDARVLSRSDYVVMPGLDEGRAPSAVMHHYVDKSKRSYFLHGWRRINIVFCQSLKKTI